MNRGIKKYNNVEKIACPYVYILLLKCVRNELLIKLKIYVMIIFPFNDIRTNSLTKEAFEIGFMRGSKYRVLTEKMLVFWSLIAWEVFAHTRWPIMRGSNFNWENFDVLDGWSFMGGSNYRTWLAKFWMFWTTDRFDYWPLFGIQASCRNRT